ncbi:MAG: NADH-quinone oxidoreductase subunit NuoH [Ignavibacteriae bacterium]|nr:NADH-quinone oxidoreductase subunit NuoH [Ignavibacteriota bacterium]MCB9215598.1 NADH-quinone oxidoreductase subunit NuoH [Ignavibacteria bacterium]
MSATLWYWIILVVKVLVVLHVFLIGAAYVVLLERKVSAWIQDRVGPNRVGWRGSLQSFADVLKLVLKEDIVPENANKFFHRLAPLITITIAIAVWAFVPFFAPIEIDGTAINGMIAPDLNVGLLLLLALGSVGVYGIALAGWASNSKYSLMGGLRASAQMISYELAMGLSLIGLLLIMGSTNISDIVTQQSGYWWGVIPKWNIFVQPLGFLIFLIAAFAETNRAPFDLAEAEPELVGGFHTEYSGLKFGLFFLGEYGNVIMMSAIMSTLFFGGYNAPWIQDIAFFQGDATLNKVALALLQFGTLSLKTVFFVFFFIWVRWSIPRFRYDQLMNLGWRVMFPLALGNTVLTAVVLALIEGMR